MNFHVKILALVDRINSEKTAAKKLPLAEELRSLLKEEKAQLARGAYAFNR